MKNEYLSLLHSNNYFLECGVCFMGSKNIDGGNISIIIFT